MQSTPSSRTVAAAGLVFVLLWSTGYIAAKFGLGGSGAYTLAVLRFVGSALLIGFWLLLQRPATTPRPSDLRRAALAGVLLQGGFFGFIYAAMHAGVSPAAAGLIAGLMPLVTALGARWFLGEPLARFALPGMALGLAGVLLVIAPKLSQPGSLLGYALAACALLALSGGTLYQRRNAGQLDPRLSLLMQLLASFIVMLPLALVFEGMHIVPSLEWAGGLLWIILVNSCAGLLLYLWLLNHGGAGSVSALFFLVPPVTAGLAALVFGEALTLVEACGFALAALGVWLGQRR